MRRKKMMMTPAQYAEAVTFFPHMSDVAADMARLVLVDGEPQVLVADNFCVTKQRVNNLVRDIYNASKTNDPNKLLCAEILALVKTSKANPKTRNTIRHFVMSLGIAR